MICWRLRCRFCGRLFLPYVSWLPPPNVLWGVLAYTGSFGFHCREYHWSGWRERFLRRRWYCPNFVHQSSILSLWSSLWYRTRYRHRLLDRSLMCGILITSKCLVPAAFAGPSLRYIHRYGVCGQGRLRRPRFVRSLFSLAARDYRTMGNHQDCYYKKFYYLDWFQKCLGWISSWRFQRYPMCWFGDVPPGGWHLGICLNVFRVERHFLSGSFGTREDFLFLRDFALYCQPRDWASLCLFWGTAYDKDS